MNPGFLLVPLLFLSQLYSAGQNKCGPDTDVHASTTSATSATIASQAFKTGHDGSIRDLSAVGKRDIGCTHGLGSRYSLQTQIEMGRDYARQIETTSRLITDPVITEYVNRIGQNLARNSDAHLQHTFKIVDTDELNAFSLPGGFVFVDSGLILAAENEAELAGVLSHEMAHVAACHITQEISHEGLIDASRMSLIFRLVFRGAIRNTVDLNPTRSFEFEADFLAIEYLHKAGYDPRALPAFLEKVRAIEKKRGNRANVPEPYPGIADRIRKAQREIDHLPPASENKLDVSEFQEVKNRLAELERNQEVDKVKVVQR